MRGGLGARADALERLSSAPEPFDVLVVGGGITGAGIALDAASRGMSVALVERADFASGTSSKSSKLIHGGLRYLEQREFGLVREASTERDLLSRLAPQLVEPIPFVIPVSGRSVRAKFGVGLWAYDALASFKNMHVHRYIDREETEKLVPALPRGKLRGGFIYYDSKTDDVRLVMEVLVQACRLGGVVANYTAVTEIQPGEETCSAEIVDVLTNERSTIEARRVVVAAGVWSDSVERLVDESASSRLRPSKGIHVLFGRDAIPMSDAAAFIPDVDRNRMLFVIPWLGAVLVGTTDDAYEGDLDSPTVEDAERAYCIESVNSAFGLDLTDADVAGAYAGLRPLIQGKSGATADLSRRHRVYDIAPGVIGITGGKMTTFRRMAADAVDRIADDLDVGSRSKTHWIRLGVSDIAALRLAVERRTRRLGLSIPHADNLVRCYGDRSLDVLDVAEREGLVGALAPGALPLAAEAAYCARFEMVCSLDDLLVRRTRLALTQRAAGIGTGSVALDVLARALGWNRRQKAAQLRGYVENVERERGFSVADEPAPEPAGDRAEGMG